MYNHEWSKITYKEQENKINFIGLIRSKIYLNTKLRGTNLYSDFKPEVIKDLKNLFFNIWKQHILQRTSELIVTEKEKDFLNYCFNWSICSKEFKGDLRKGLFMASKNITRQMDSCY